MLGVIMFVIMIVLTYTALLRQLAVTDASIVAHYPTTYY